VDDGADKVSIVDRLKDDLNISLQKPRLCEELGLVTVWLGDGLWIVLHLGLGTLRIKKNISIYHSHLSLKKRTLMPEIMSVM
jgi:hypothetical protein